MESTKREGRPVLRRVGGTLVAVATSKLVVDMLADQPRSVRLAAAVVWAVAFVCVWELLLRTVSPGKFGGNKTSP